MLMVHFGTGFYWCKPIYGLASIFTNENSGSLRGSREGLHVTNTYQGYTDIAKKQVYTISVLSSCKFLASVNRGNWPHVFRSERAADQQEHVRTRRVGPFLFAAISACQNRYPWCYQRPQSKPTGSYISRFPVSNCILQRYHIKTDGISSDLGGIRIRRSPIIHSQTPQTIQLSAFQPNRISLCGGTQKYSSSLAVTAPSN